MSDPVVEEVDDLGQPTANGELIHWMAPKPVSLGAVGISATAASAFVAGIAVSLSVLALLHWLDPDRKLELPWRRGG